MMHIENANILVIGDIMLDRYIVGEVERISPEAPVPIVNVTNTYHTLGGCGNVVRNLRSIGANVSCLAVVGDDESGEIIKGELYKCRVKSMLTTLQDRATSVKTRVVANHRQTQMLRFDNEDTSEVNVQDLALSVFNFSIFDIIVISDYAKGIITNDLMSKIKELNIPIIVDPKPKNIKLYNDVFMITPNRKEYQTIVDNGDEIFTTFILKTLGRDGMELHDCSCNQVHHIKSEPIEVYNVTGAGDTVVAVMAACIASKIDILLSAKIANECAHFVVTQPGTTTIPKKLFNEILNKRLEEV
jgi:rfaE bifunctional protein kinase chain/domain